MIHQKLRGNQSCHAYHPGHTTHQHTNTQTHIYTQRESHACLPPSYHSFFVWAHWAACVRAFLCACACFVCMRVQIFVDACTIICSNAQIG
jgi:hypothetical protein